MTFLSTAAVSTEHISYYRMMTCPSTASSQLSAPLSPTNRNNITRNVLFPISVWLDSISDSLDRVFAVLVCCAARFGGCLSTFRDSLSVTWIPVWPNYTHLIIMFFLLQFPRGENSVGFWLMTPCHARNLRGFKMMVRTSENTVLWFVTPCTLARTYPRRCSENSFPFRGTCQGRIKLFGAPRQWKHFRPLFQAVFLSRGGITPPQTE